MAYKHIDPLTTSTQRHFGISRIGAPARHKATCLLLLFNILIVLTTPERRSYAVTQFYGILDLLLRTPFMT